MSLKQVSIFIENREGRLADVAKTLADAKINIRALSLADTADFGMLRLIVNEPDRCCQVLKEKGFMVKETDVLAVEVEDSPGGLFKVLGCLDSAKINVEYMYASVEKTGKNAIVIFKVDEKEKTIKALQSCGIALATEDILKNV